MLIKLLGTVFFVILIIGAIGYWSGWVRFNSSGDTSTIEVNSKEMKADTNKAIEKGKDLVEKTGKFFQGEKDSRKNDSPSPDASMQH